jgi:hypothetical protein
MLAGVFSGKLQESGISHEQGGAIMSDELDPDHWVNGGECDHPHPDALAMEALDTENKQLRAEVERLKEAQRWISVQEQLPETRDPVLTLWVSGMQSVKQYDEQHGWNTGAQVTHWMPLPEPPEALP